MSKKKSEHEWFNLIQACRASGLTDRQWCMQNGIVPATFYYQAKKLKEASYELTIPTKATQTVISQDVVEIFPMSPLMDEPTLPQINEVLPPAIKLTIAGVCIELENHASPLLVTTIVQALGARC